MNGLSRHIVFGVFLATLASIISQSSLATTAVAISGTAPAGQNYGVAVNANGKEAANQAAILDCRNRSGKSDCEVILTKNQIGFGALYADCPTSTSCGVSAMSGFKTKNEAHDRTNNDCMNYYGAKSCTPLADWQESGVSSTQNQAVIEVPSQPPPLNREAKAENEIGSRPALDSKTKPSENNDQAQNSAYIAELSKLMREDLYFDFNNAHCQSENWTAKQTSQLNIDTETQTNYGVCLFLGKCGLKKDQAQAIQWWLKAAQGGDFWGQYYLSKAYLMGQGINKNHSEAFRWSQAATNQNIPKHAKVIGEFYFLGLGVKQDYAKSLEWFKKSDFGPVPVYYVGYMNYYGIGTKKNTLKGIKVMKSVFDEYGYEPAQEILQKWGSN